MTDVTTDSPSAANGGAAKTEGATEKFSAAASAKAREAFGLLKQHPLGAVATVAAATALIEVEIAVGFLAGLGATAFLATRSGPEARKDALERGKSAYARARSAIASRRKATPPAAAASPPSG
jgi:hypothetical protein